MLNKTQIPSGELGRRVLTLSHPLLSLSLSRPFVTALMGCKLLENFIDFLPSLPRLFLDGRRRRKKKRYVPHDDGRMMGRNCKKESQSLRSQKAGHVRLILDASVRAAASVGFGQLRVPVGHFFTHRQHQEEGKEQVKIVSVEVGNKKRARESSSKSLSNKKKEGKGISPAPQSITVLYGSQWK